MKNSIIKEIKQEAKQKKREANKMRNQSRKETFKTWTIVTLITLIIVAITYGVGMMNGIGYEKAKNQTIQAQAKALGAKTEAPLK